MRVRLLPVDLRVARRAAHGIEWPLMLAQALHGLAARIGEDQDDGPSPEPGPPRALVEAVAGGLSRFFTRSRPQPEQP